MEVTLHLIDYIIVVGYILLVIGIGTSFSKKRKTGKSFFTGSGGIPSWAIGLSLLATLISSVTFLGYPGEGFNNNWVRLVQGLMVPIVLVFFIWFIVPLYRSIIKVSVYEFFEQRFGYGARLYTSLAFLFASFSSMGTVFFLITLTLSQMLGVNAYLIIWVLGFAIILYSILGGLEAIIWTDVLQAIVFIIGGLTCLGYLLVLPDMGPWEMITTAYAQGRMSLGPYDWDFTRLTFAVMAINGIFYAIQKYGTDQTVVQRYLASDTDGEAVKASFMGVLLTIPVWMLFMFIGTALWAYYILDTGVLPAGIRPDAVFPYFIMTELPPGVVGLIIADVIAAALSSLDSTLNALSSVCVEDYYLRFKPGGTDKELLFVGRLTTFIAGVVAMAIATLYLYAGDETALSILFTLYAIFSGGIVGLFLLGILTTRANKKGVYIGIFVCILFTGYAFLTSTPISIGGEDRLLLDLGSFNYTHHTYMLGVYSHLVLLAVGYVASYFFKSEKEIEKLTIYPWLKARQGHESNKEGMNEVKTTSS